MHRAQLDEQTHAGQHESVGKQDRALDPRQGPYRPLPLRSRTTVDRKQRQHSGDRLEQGRGPEQQRDPETALPAGAFEGTSDRVEQPRTAQPPVDTDPCIDEPENERRLRCRQGERRSAAAHWVCQRENRL